MLSMARVMRHRNRVTYGMLERYKSLEVVLPRWERKKAAIAQIMGAGIRDNAQKRRTASQKTISYQYRGSYVIPMQAYEKMT